MATSIDCKASKQELASSDAEKVYLYVCTPCGKDGRRSLAEHYCLECCTYFCSQCVKVHNAFLDSHTLLDGFDMASSLLRTQTPPNTKPLVCLEHPGKDIDMFCCDHDVVCCTLCITVKHRSCDRIEKVSEIATKMANRSETEKAKERIGILQKDLILLKSKRAENLSSLLNENYAQITKDITMFRDRLIAKAHAMEAEAINELKTLYKDIEDNIQRDIKSIDDMLNIVDIQLDSVTKASTDANETNWFIQTKLCNACKSQIEEFIETIDAHHVDDGIECDMYDIDEDPQLVFEDLIEISHQRAFTPYRASLLDTHRIAVESDENVPRIFGCCTLDNGEVILADCNNNKVKRLTEHLAINDFIDLQGTPYGVCSTGPQEIAVTLESTQTVQFISVGQTMSLLRSFLVGEPCRGISYDQGQLYICCGGNDFHDETEGHVRVYDKKGTMTNKITNDGEGKGIFFFPRSLIVSNHLSRLVVTDCKENAIKLVDTLDNETERVADTDIDYAVGIAMDGHANMFVCGFNSNNVIQLSRDGQDLGAILSDIDKPISIAHLKYPNRLVVCGDCSSDIKVYELR